MPVALVCGASGAIGRYLLPRLLGAGYQVIALSRVARDSDDARLQWRIGDLEHVLPDLPALDLVLSCGPLDAFARWFARTPARIVRVVAFGSMSIESKQASPDAAERALVERLHEAEQSVMTTAQARAGAWTLLRPTLIYGAAVDRSLTPLAHLARRWRVFPRIPAAHGLRQPVHADDLAGACVAVATNPRSAGKVYALGGGERLAFSEMLERVHASLPFRALSLPLPLTLWRPFAHRLPALERLQRDLVADDREATADFGWAPRAFRPDAACWFASPMPSRFRPPV
ncbi:NAD-dependent epimerase/dehydratase family protein [Dokdonella sp.]|uniref:NAD-dependent epimerase/dehydratase family protein n=1 Tax=Dokdonella sp. TaxID=2291710 RepID=UPI0037835748